MGSSVPAKASGELHNQPADTGCTERGLVWVSNAASRLGTGERGRTEKTRLALGLCHSLWAVGRPSQWHPAELSLGVLPAIHLTTDI